MSKLIRLVFMTIALVGSTVAFAADAPAAKLEAPSLKVGVLDWQRLIATAPQAKEAGKRLEKEFQEPGELLNNKQKEFQTKREKLLRDQDILSKAERAKKEKELVRIEQDLRRMDEELRSESAARHREEMDEFVKTVRSIVETYAKKEKYDLVLPQEVMVYFGERVDVTDKILGLLETTKDSAKSTKK